MKKLILLLGLAIGYISQAQIFVPPTVTIYGEHNNRVQIDSAFLYPTGCGAPTSLKSVDKKHSALYYDSCGHALFAYDPSTSTWDTVGNGTGGGGGGGVTLHIGVINSLTKSLNGAVIQGDSIVFQTADQIFPGLLSNTDKKRIDTNRYLVPDATFDAQGKKLNDTVFVIKSQRIQVNGVPVTPIVTDTSLNYNLDVASGGDSSVFSDVIDTTGQPSQRVLFSIAPNHIGSSPNFLYDSVNKKLVINTNNAALGGAGIKLYVAGGIQATGSSNVTALLTTNTLTVSNMAAAAGDTTTYKPVGISSTGVTRKFASWGSLGTPNLQQVTLAGPRTTLAVFSSSTAGFTVDAGGTSPPALAQIGRNSLGGFLYLDNATAGNGVWIKQQQAKTGYDSIYLPNTGFAADTLATTRDLRSNIPSGVFGNPMTSVGDIIVGGVSGTPTRLGIGAGQSILTVSGGTPIWATGAPWNGEFAATTVGNENGVTFGTSQNRIVHTGGTASSTLPLLSSGITKAITLQNAGTGNWTLNRQSSDVIYYQNNSSATSFVLAPGQSCIIVPTNSKWQVSWDGYNPNYLTTVPTLQQVTDAGQTTSNAIIVQNSIGSEIIADNTLGTHVDLETSAINFADVSAGVQSPVVRFVKTGGTNPGYLYANALNSGDRFWRLPDSSGTIALASSIPSASRFGVSGEDALATQDRTFSLGAGTHTFTIRDDTAAIFALSGTFPGMGLTAGINGVTSRYAGIYASNFDFNHYVQMIAASSFGGSFMTIKLDKDADEIQIVPGTNPIKLFNYGSGTNTGTPTYGLAVDASHRLIETSLSGGVPAGAYQANFYLKDSSFSSNRTADLNSKWLKFTQGGNNVMKIDPTLSANRVTIGVEQPDSIVQSLVLNNPSQRNLLVGLYKNWNGNSVRYDDSTSYNIIQAYDSISSNNTNTTVQVGKFPRSTLFVNRETWAMANNIRMEEMGALDVSKRLILDNVDTVLTAPSGSDFIYTNRNRMIVENRASTHRAVIQSSPSSDWDVTPVALNTLELQTLAGSNTRMRRFWSGTTSYLIGVNSGDTVDNFIGYYSTNFLNNNKILKYYDFASSTNGIARIDSLWFLYQRHLAGTENSYSYIDGRVSIGGGRTGTTHQLDVNGDAYFRDSVHIQTTPASSLSTDSVLVKDVNGKVRARAQSDVASAASSLAGLSDVNVSSPGNGQVLTYQTSDNKWHNVSATGAGIGTYWDRLNVSPSNGTEFFQTTDGRDAPAARYYYLNSTWNYTPMRREAMAIDYFNDFVSGYGATNSNDGNVMLIQFTGTGAGVSAAALTVDGYGGRFTTGTTTTGNVLYKTGGTGAGSNLGIKASTSSMYYKITILNLSALSDGTNTYTAEFGFSNNSNAHPATTGYIFQYNQSSNTNWLYRNGNGSLNSTGVTVTTGAATLEILVRSDSAFYWINGTQVAAETTTSNTTLVGPIAYIAKSAGTTAVTMDVDYLKIWARLQSTRN